MHVSSQMKPEFRRHVRGNRHTWQHCQEPWPPRPCAAAERARKRSRHHRYSAEFLYFLADGIPAYHSTTLLGAFEGAANADDNVLQIVWLAGVSGIDKTTLVAAHEGMGRTRWTCVTISLPSSFQAWASEALLTRAVVAVIEYNPSNW